MDEKGGLPVLAFASAAEWDAWLVENAAAAPGLWLRLAKRDTGVVGVSYDEALEGALRHGWIDSQRAGLDDRFWLQRFTRRRSGSRWSQRNRATALRLIEEGRMAPAGQAEVHAAQADGRWDQAYPGAAATTVPDDLRAALDAAPSAALAFEGLDAANRYAILYRVHDAKRPGTRSRRIAQFVAMLERGDRVQS